MFPNPQSKSAALFERAGAVMPGANTRHMITFGPYIVYAERGEGCRLTDVDGAVYLDWVNNFASLIHGHGYAPVVDAVRDQLDRLISCILPAQPELELAELLVERFPGVEHVRFMNSGTEAMMVAVKGARGHTGRSTIVKCEGAYHGQYDLVEASFLPTPENWGPLEKPAVTGFAKGHPDYLLDHVVVIPMNEPEIAQALLAEHADDIAAVIIDPMPARLGFIQNEPAFLETLRGFCDDTGAVLIFDEVFCARAGYHGAQGEVGVTPDLTVLGKIIGGGFPIGAVGGRADVMAVFDNRSGPLPVSHSGTFTGNPVSMVAGLQAMRAMTPERFDALAAHGDRLRAGMTRHIERLGLNMRVNGYGSMSSVQFFKTPIRSYRDFHRASGPGYLDRMLRLHACMLNAGVLMATRGLMIGSTAMTDADIDETIERAGRALEAFADVDAQAA